jgi:hypothetical protein
MISSGCKGDNRDNRPFKKNENSLFCHNIKTQVEK